MMIVDNKYELGQVVYLVTDIDQYPRMVVAIQISKEGTVYILAQGEDYSVHYDFEIAPEKDLSLAAGGGTQA